MKRACLHAALIVSVFGSAAIPALAQPAGPPSPEQIARMRMIGTIRAQIGNSGLRRFLSESASLGEVRNRAASYRIIEQVEGARVAAIEGRISALEGLMRDPTLPVAEQSRLQALVDESQAELAAVPAYRARYHTSTVQAGALAELGFLGKRPAFAFIKGRLVRRTDPDDYLRVSSARVDLAPVIFPSTDWFLSAGFTARRTEVDVLSFDGTSGTTSVGMRLDVGAVFGDHWALGAHATQLWTDGTTNVTRPGPEPIPIESNPSTRSVSAKIELMGRFGGEDIRWLPDFLEIAPRAGAYVMRTAYDLVTNSLGQADTGVFGSSDALALLAAGLAFEFDTGIGLAPNFYLGMDRELPSDMTDVLADRTGFVMAGALTYVIGRSQRMGVTYTFARSTGGRRESGELDFVGVIDF